MHPIEEAAHCAFDTCDSRIPTRGVYLSNSPEGLHCCPLGAIYDSLTRNTQELYDEDMENQEAAIYEKILEEFGVSQDFLDGVADGWDHPNSEIYYQSIRSIEFMKGYDIGKRLACYWLKRA